MMWQKYLFMRSNDFVSGAGVVTVLWMILFVAAGVIVRQLYQKLNK